MSSDPQKPNEELAALRGNIEQTRTEMSGTLRALEQKLNPQDLRDKAASELVLVEDHVKAAVKEQLSEVRGIVKEELQDAQDAISVLMITAKDTVIKDTKDAVSELMVNAKHTVIKDAKEAVGDLMATAKDTVIKDAKDAASQLIAETKDAVKDDVIAIKDSVKQDVSEALTHAKTAARAATLGKLEDFATQAGDVMTTARDTFVDTVRQNPIPAALAGLGILWLFMNRSSSKNAQRSNNGITVSERGERSPGFLPRAQHAISQAVGSTGEAVSSFAHDAGQRANHLAHDAKDAAGNAIHSATDAAGNVVHTVTDAAGNAIHTVTDAAGNVLHTAKDAAGNAIHAVADTAKGAATSVGQTASHLAGQASQYGGQLAHSAGDMAQHAGHSITQFGHEIPIQARRVEQRMERTYMDNPLAVGATVLAVGALVGMSLPRSRHEDALMGETRNRLVHGAQDLANEAVSSIRHMAEDPMGTVTEALNANT